MLIEFKIHIIFLFIYNNVIFCYFSYLELHQIFNKITFYQISYHRGVKTLRHFITIVCQVVRPNPTKIPSCYVT